MYDPSDSPDPELVVLRYPDGQLEQTRQRNRVAKRKWRLQRYQQTPDGIASKRSQSFDHQQHPTILPDSLQPPDELQKTSGPELQVPTTIPRVQSPCMSHWLLSQATTCTPHAPDHAEFPLEAYPPASAPQVPPERLGNYDEPLPPWADGSSLSTRNTYVNPGDGELEDIGTVSNYRQPERVNLLHLAIRNRSSGIVGILLNAGADVNAMNAQGQTPLHGAIQQSQRDMVQMLVLNGADVNAVDSSGATPLELAVRNRDEEMVQTLVEVGACVQ